MSQRLGPGFTIRGFSNGSVEIRMNRWTTRNMATKIRLSAEEVFALKLALVRKSYLNKKAKS